MPGFSSRLLVALALTSLLTGCSGGDGDEGAAGKQGGKGTAARPAALGVTVVSADVQAMAPQPPAFPDDVKAAVTASLDAYLNKAVVAPLRTGRPPTTGLDGVFTASAWGRLAAPGPDRSALFEEGSPVSGRVRQDRAEAALTALTAPGGEVVLVTARLDLAHIVRTGPAKGASGVRDVAVVRSGEVVLVPVDGWRIDAYDLRTARDTRPVTAR